MALEEDKDDKNELMQIGRFTRSTRLSRKALRLYEKLGILRPVRIDPDSGYRYYSEQQVGLARLIHLLREMDMSLKLVQKVISAEPIVASHLVEAYQQSFAQRAHIVKQSANVVQQIIRQENYKMSFEIQVKEVPAQTVASHKARVKIDDLQGHINTTLMLLHKRITENGAQIAGDPICMYHGPINEESDGPIEICWPYAGDRLAATEQVAVRDLPAHKLGYHHADAAHSRFPEILQVWYAVIDWAKENGYDKMPQGLECYEIWPEDRTVAVGWPFFIE